MITIARFSKPEEAHLLRLRLGTGGVPAYILDENMVQMDWLYSNAIGGVRVQVSDEDLADAREILQELPPDDLPAVIPACPACASHHTVPDEFLRRMSFLSIMILSLPLPLPVRVFRNRWKCEDCRHTWSLPR